MPTHFSYILIIAILTFLVLLVHHAAKSKNLGLPPGPKGYPIFKNIFDQPKYYPWRTWLEWSRIYGPVFSLQMPGGQVFIVLNTHKAVTDLLEKKGAIYSDRPRSIVAGEYGTGGNTSLFMPYGPRWRTVRKLMHHGLNVRAASSYQPIQERETKVLLRDLADNPTSFASSFQRYTTSVVIEIVYGRRVPNSDDSKVGKIKDMVGRLITSAQPGAHIVEFLPFLDHFPDIFSPWRVQAKHLYKEMSTLFLQELKEGRHRTEKDKSIKSFIRFLDESTDKEQVDETQKAFIAGDLYAAGAETTAGVLSIFVMAMSLYPSFQKKAHEEIDKVIGSERLPSFDDWDQLPYVHAIISELHRWRPVGPIGFPRRIIQDDVYEGYKIPKGSMIIYNTWAINRNTTYYTDPEEFNPERFLKTPLPPQPYPFASGRRVCPGRDVASRSLFIVISSILATMKIEKEKGRDGKEIDIDPFNFVDSGVSYPNPFEAIITPRTERCRKLIEEAHMEIEDQL